MDLLDAGDEDLEGGHDVPDQDLSGEDVDRLLSGEGEDFAEGMEDDYGQEEENFHFDEEAEGAGEGAVEEAELLALGEEEYMEEEEAAAAAAASAEEEDAAAAVEEEAAALHHDEATAGEQEEAAADGDSVSAAAAATNKTQAEPRGPAGGRPPRGGGPPRGGHFMPRMLRPPHPLMRFHFGPRGPPPPGMRPPPPHFRMRGPPGMFHPGFRGPHGGFRGRGGPPPPHGHMGGPPHHLFPPRPPPPGFRGRGGGPPRHLMGGPLHPPFPHPRGEYYPGRGGGGGRPPGPPRDRGGKAQPGAPSQIRTILTGSGDDGGRGGGSSSGVAKKRPLMAVGGGRADNMPAKRPHLMNNSGRGGPPPRPVFAGPRGGGAPSQRGSGSGHGYSRGGGSPHAPYGNGDGSRRGGNNYGGGGGQYNRGGGGGPHHYSSGGGQYNNNTGGSSSSGGHYNSGGSGGRYGSGQAGSSQYHPAQDMGGSSSSSYMNGQCHSNLRTITLVETPPPAKIQPRTNQSTRSSQIIHNPSPALTSIPIQMDCDIPDVKPQLGRSGLMPNMQGSQHSDKKVLVQNLPASVNFDKISAMAKACGSVMAIQVHSESKSAVVEFSEASSADHFTRLHNRKMMDLAIISVSRLN